MAGRVVHGLTCPTPAPCPARGEGRMRGRLSRSGAVALVMLLAAWLTVPCPAAEPMWKAGSAKEKITPERPMWLAGYGGRNHPATGLLNDLWARALVLEDPAGTRVAIVALDLVGIGAERAEAINKELARKYALDAAHVALCCSHTHSGP